jgi:phosphoglycolate phosphatase-like HAD superfamily hydrolase
VTRPGSRDFVPVAERIAVFDNDGTLWVEQPMYTQLAFALDRAKQVAPSMSVDTRSEQGVMALMAKTHANTTTDEFEQLVEDWIEDAEHLTLHRRYTDLVYAPMLELLAYLRANGFSTYIASGGGVDFMRPFSERVYGVPRDHVIGSRIALRYEIRDGVPVLMRLPAIYFVDYGPG